MPKTIKQTAKFKVSHEVVYDALMDSKKHSKFTGQKAVMSDKVGAKFTAYDGYIDGKNEELVKNKKIVQSWRGSDWPEGHYSTVTYKIEKDGKGTKLTFTQLNVPDDQVKSIS